MMFVVRAFAILIALIAPLHAASWLPLSSVPAPSIYMDFAGGYYLNGSSSVAASILISTSRASTGYATNSDGTLTSFATNTPRIGVGTGLLVEEARTNLALYSQDYSQTATWQYAFFSTGAITRTAASAIAPDGTNTGYLIADNSTNNTNYGPVQVIGIATSSTYAFSVILKAKDYQYVQINALTSPNSALTGGTNHFGFFDLTNGVTTGTPSGLVSQSITALSNGWYRCTVVFTSSGTHTFAGPTIVYNNSNSISNHTGVVGTGTYFWGSQNELGPFPTSYIPTTTASVTRAADNITATDALQTALNSAERSAVINLGILPSIAGPPSILNLNNAATTNIASSIATATTASITANNVATTATLGSGSYTTTATKTGSSWGASGDSIVADNGTVATSANVMVPTSNIQIGARSSSASFVNGYIQRLSVWNSRLPDASLKALTQ